MRKFYQKNYFFYFFIFLFFSSCIFSEKKNVALGFYFWRTRFNLNASEKKILEDFEAAHLYVKILDIDWSDDEKFPIQVGAIDTFPVSNQKINITPVIFITNRTFFNISENLIDSFAEAVVKKCFSYSGFAYVKEIQFDCDWTETTRQKYFLFLEKIKKHFEFSENKNIQLSATIRLYPYKYFQKTGVPPVHAGMLMVYNLNALDEPETRNAILDIPTLKTYLTGNKKYPIPLGLALPIYAQGVILRDGRAVHLFNNLTSGEVENDLHFTKQTTTTYSVKQNCYFKGVYIYADDVLRFDEVSKENLLEASELLSKKFRNNINEICFFSLDSLCLKNYNPEDLYKVLSVFDNF